MNDKEQNFIIEEFMKQKQNQIQKNMKPFTILFLKHVGFGNNGRWERKH